MTALAAVPPAGEVPTPRRIAAVAAVLGAMALVVLDAAIANLALPSIGQALRASPATTVGVVTAYQLGLVVALLPAAALGDAQGRRRIFAGGVALFGAASLLCAMAPSLPWLLAARFVQGLGGAAVMALGVALLRAVVGKDRLGAAIGWNALTVALASAAGPAVGAAILSAAGWPWLFAVNLPVAAGVLVAARALPAGGGTGGRLDLAGVALNGGAFTLMVAAAELAATRPAPAAVLVVGALACAALLIRRETGRPFPLLPLDLLRARGFRISVIASVLLFAGQTAGLVALPFHLQHGLGLAPLAAGLYLTPWPLAVAVAAPLAGRLAGPGSTTWLRFAGGALLTAGLAAAAAWPVHRPPIGLAVCATLCGLGFGLFNVPNNRAMFLSVPQARSGAAGGLQGMARLAGQTAGGLVMTLLFALSAGQAAPRIGLAFGAVLTLAAGLVGLASRGAAAAPRLARDG